MVHVMEQLLKWVLLAAILCAIISGALVYGNQRNTDKRFLLLRDMTEGINVFFTSKYLNETGKRWRPYFLISVLYIVFYFLYESF